MQEARTFFSRSEDFRTLAAATERIYPEDDNGPGAIELGVPYFIDKQLAGFWGSNSKDYTKGPFKPQASDTHGLQSKMNRGEMFLVGLQRMQEISKKDHDEKFYDLDGETQDAILESFESGDVKIRGMRSDTFFTLLRNTTIEGVYSDPAYGGNKDMQGWKMMEYPGPYVGWTNDIDAEEFLSKEPTSLRAYQGGGV
nr:gluconate 2-dehydrogenase subunit 3 family protein [Lentibacillus sp. JNUCC-1]